VTPSKFLPSQPSLEFIRKQAKKLVRQFAAGDSDAVARVHARLPSPTLPLSLRDAQLVLAREFGFAGWNDLRVAVLGMEGRGLQLAAAEAQRAIHENNVERLKQLVQEHPALLLWRDDSGESLLASATASFGDSGDAHREKMFTRIECAEFLLDAGSAIEPAIWKRAISARANGVLQLLMRKGVLPRTLDVLAALGDIGGARDCLPTADAAAPHAGVPYCLPLSSQTARCSPSQPLHRARPHARRASGEMAGTKRLHRLLGRTSHGVRESLAHRRHE